MTDNSSLALTFRSDAENLIFTATFPFVAEASSTDRFVFLNDERIHRKDLDFLVALAERMGITTSVALEAVYQQATGWSADFFRRLAASLDSEGTDHWQSGPSTPYLLVLLAAHALQLSPEDMGSLGWDEVQAQTILRVGAETVSGDVKQCIYCSCYKPVGDFSLEHIFPDAMGGNVCPDLFRTRSVCRRCNSTAGLFVDGPVIRSWIGKNAEATAYRDFVDLNSSTSWLPFNYVGPDRAGRFGDDEVCEIWVGPFGEHVYHVRQKDDPRYDNYVGGNPINRRSDPGRAYLFLTDRNEKKISLTIRSFERQFKKASRYAGNFDLQGDEHVRRRKFVAALPPELAQEHAMLHRDAMAGREWSTRVGFQVGFEERFLAKVARGLGYQLMGEAYLATPYAKRVRRAMWEQDPMVRNGLFRSLPFSSPRLKLVKDHLGFSGAYCLLLWALADDFVLALALPDGSIASVVISDEPKLWSDNALEMYRDGVMYIVTPQLQSCLGPLAFPEFLAHKLGSLRHASISALEELRVRWDT
jgi:hypothetical protein